MSKKLSPPHNIDDVEKLVKAADLAQHSGELARAATLLAHAATLRPDAIDIRFKLAQSQHALGRSDQAIAMLMQMFAENPKLDVVLAQLGNIFLDQSNFDKARWYFEKAIKLNPNFINYYNLGRSKMFLGLLDDAQADLNHSLSTGGSDSALVHFALGFVLGARQHFHAADAALSRSLELNPNFVDALVNRGATRISLRRYEEGLLDLNRALALQPDHLVAQCNKGDALLEMEQFDMARNQFSLALQQHGETPDICWGLALTELSLGKFDDGWKWYESRTAIDSLRIGVPRTQLPCWTGDNDPGRLLVFAEQGLGDTIFFMYAAQALAQQNISLTIKVDSRLVTLLSRSFKDIRFTSSKEELSEANFDSHILLGSLWLAISKYSKRSVRSTPLQPWMIADRNRSERIRAELIQPGHKLIGICWRAPKAANAAEKSASLLDLLPLLQAPNCTFVSVQYGDVSEEIKRFAEQTGVFIQAAQNIDIFSDIDGLASVVNACDYIVTVASSTAHIAGALGKRGCVLVPYGRGRFFYWNNKIDRKSFWYPSLTLANQENDLSWQKPVEIALRSLEICDFDAL